MATRPPNPNQGSLFPEEPASPSTDASPTVDVQARVRVNQAFIRDFKASVDTFGTFTREFKTAVGSMDQALKGGHIFNGGNTGQGTNPFASQAGGPPRDPNAPFNANGGGPGGPQHVHVTNFSELVAMWGGPGGGGSGPGGSGPAPGGNGAGGLGGGPASGQPSAGGSQSQARPYGGYGDEDAGLSDWQVAAKRNSSIEGANQPFRLPSIGEVQPDRIPQFLADLRLRKAVQAQQAANRVQRDGGDNPTNEQIAQHEAHLAEAARYGNQGRRLMQGATAVAGTITAYKGLRALGAKMSGPGDAGLAAGYEAGSTVGTNALGVQLPNLNGDGAMNEGLRQKATGARIGMMAGVSKEQGDQIVQELAANGYTGGEGTHLAMDYLAPLVREGMDPGQGATIMTKGIRNGTTSVSEMADAMTDLGTAARGARMSLRDYTEGLDAMAEKMQEGGATYGDAFRGARDISQTLGMTPQQASQVTGSAGVKQAALLNAGGTLMPDQYDAAMAKSPVFAMDSINRAGDMYMSAARNLPIPTDSDGNPIMTRKEAQETFAAQRLGMSTETFTRLRQNRKILKPAGDIMKGLSDLTSKQSSLAKSYGDYVKKDKDGILKTRGGEVQKTDKYREDKQILERGYRLSNDEVDENGEKKKIYLSDEERESLKTKVDAVSQADQDYWNQGHGKGLSYDKLEKKMAALAPKKGTKQRENWDDDLKKYGGMSDNKKKAEKYREMISNRMQSVNPEDSGKDKVLFDLTPAARKLLTSDDERDLKRDKNSGAARYAEPEAPSEPSNWSYTG